MSPNLGRPIGRAGLNIPCGLSSARHVGFRFRTVDFFFCGSGSTLGDTKPTVTWLVRASNPGLILRYVVSVWLPTPPSGPSPPTLRCWCCSAAAGAGLSFAPSSRWLPSVTCTGTRVFLSAGRRTRNARDEPAPTNVVGDAFSPEQAARSQSTGLSAMRLAFTSCKM